MKKYEVSETFIREAFEAACEMWKGKIKKEFPELFEVKFKVGKWYKNLTWEGSYMLYNGISEGGFFKCIGVTTDGTWLDKGNWGYYENYILATKEEIETMLWKEAEKRGIGKNTKIEKSITQIGDRCDNDVCYTIGYDIDFDELWNINGCIYKNGQWATPLNENKEIQEKIDSLQKQLDELKLKVR